MDQATNAALNQKEYLEEKPFLESFPQIINLQANNNCNAKCVYCEIHGLNKKSFNAGIMPLELVKKNIGIFEKAKYVELSVTGEPFLYPYLNELVELLAPLGISFFITTNGLDINEDLLKKVLPFTKSLTISTDGPETNILTRGYDFKRVLPALKLISEYQKEYDFNLNLSAVLTKLNLEDSLKLLDIADEYGCKTVIYTKVLFLKEELKPGYLPSYQDFVNFLKGLSEAGSRFPSLRIVNTLRRVKNWHCPVLWKNFYLFPNGDILACCIKNELMGNINEQPFEQIWNSPKYVTLRKNYRQICGDCMHLLLSKYYYRDVYEKI